MNNKTSKELSSAKLDSRKYHAKQNEKLYKEYLESSAQFTITFSEWKKRREKKNKKRKKESMQKPLTNGEKKARSKKNPRSLNEIYRYT